MGLAYRLEPVSARYPGPHTYTHYIPPLTARGEGEALDEVNISANGWDNLMRYCRIFSPDQQV